MDIRNKNPHLFHAFGFRLLVEKCSLRATKSYIYIYIYTYIYIYVYIFVCVCICARARVCMCSYRFAPPRLSLRAFFVCDPCAELKSLISNPIANGIIDWSRHHTEKHTYTWMWHLFSHTFIHFLIFLKIMSL